MTFSLNLGPRRPGQRFQASRALVLGLGVAGLLASTGATAGDEPIVAPEGIEQQEVDAFQETAGRYSARMNEFKDEAKVKVKAWVKAITNLSL